MKLFIFILLMLIPLSSALIISEVESNPPGSDAGNEWVEFYNEEQISLINYTIQNNDGDEITLNKSFSGFYVYTFPKQWLDNSDEAVFLYNGNTLVDKTILLEDTEDTDFSFSFCKKWEFIKSTKKAENSCVQENQPNPEPLEPELEAEEPKQEANNSPLSTQETSKTINSSPEEETIKQEPIILNPKTIKTTENNKNPEKKSYARYSIVIFCILLLLLFILKPRKRKNEFN